MKENLEIEIWKDVIGYEKLYQVSNMGRIKNLTKEKILKPYHCTKGYLQVKLFKDKKSKIIITHRLVGITFLPNPENKPQINHINGVKDDNRLNNLEWVTQSENILHAIETGLKISSKGTNHGMSKLTEKEVLEIRSKYIPKKYTTYKLALEYNVSRTLICYIINRKSWSHI